MGEVHDVLVVCSHCWSDLEVTNRVRVVGGWVSSMKWLKCMKWKLNSPNQVCTVVDIQLLGDGRVCFRLYSLE